MELKYNSIFLKGENQGKEKENKRWLIKIISYIHQRKLSKLKLFQLRWQYCHFLISQTTIKF